MCFRPPGAACFRELPARVLRVPAEQAERLAVQGGPAERQPGRVVRERRPGPAEPLGQRQPEQPVARLAEGLRLGPVRWSSHLPRGIRS